MGNARRDVEGAFQSAHGTDWFPHFAVRHVARIFGAVIRRRFCQRDPALARVRRAECAGRGQEAGYQHLMDWGFDDQRVWLKTRFGRILSISYPSPTNDLPMLHGRNFTPVHQPHRLAPGRVARSSRRYREPRPEPSERHRRMTGIEIRSFGPRFRCDPMRSRLPPAQHRPTPPPGPDIEAGTGRLAVQRFLRPAPQPGPL